MARKRETNYVRRWRDYFSGRSCLPAGEVIDKILAHCLHTQQAMRDGEKPKSLNRFLTEVWRHFAPGAYLRLLQKTRRAIRALETAGEIRRVKASDGRDAFTFVQNPFREGNPFE